MHYETLSRIKEYGYGKKETISLNVIKKRKTINVVIYLLLYMQLKSLKNIDSDTNFLQNEEGKKLILIMMKCDNFFTYKKSMILKKIQQISML